ncbi:hypothetical protein [Hymenobacter saemangeumensis]|uniref:hypothetical protein n=1 Tax=Hymenobacter saemangeumensis TaxID=1084522 RepID=UPI0031E6992B
MPLMLINAPDDGAVAAVQHLSSVQVLAVVAGPQPTKPVGAAPQKPRSWLGLLPQEAGQRMLKEVAELRDEWERNS